MSHNDPNRRRWRVTFNLLDRDGKFVRQTGKIVYAPNAEEARQIICNLRNEGFAVGKYSHEIGLIFDAEPYGENHDNP